MSVSLKDKFFTEQTLTLDDGQTEVVVRVNDKVVQRIKKYYVVILEQRGLPTPNTIDETHPDVVKKLQGRAKGNKEFAKIYRRRQRGQKLENQELEQYTRYALAAINAVKNAYEPDFQLVMFQIAAWSVLYDDLFSFDENKNLQCRLEVEIPEHYWSSGVDTSAVDVDPLDELISGFTPQPKRLTLDRNNPLEWMLAIVTSLMSDDQNPKFTEKLNPYLVKALGYIQLEGSDNVDVDEAGFQLAEVVRDLEGEIQSENSDDDGGTSRRRVRKTPNQAAK